MHWTVPLQFIDCNLAGMMRWKWSRCRRVTASMPKHGQSKCTHRRETIWRENPVALVINVLLWTAWLIYLQICRNEAAMWFAFHSRIYGFWNWGFGNDVELRSAMTNVNSVTGFWYLRVRQYNPDIQSVAYGNKNLCICL